MHTARNNLFSAAAVLAIAMVVGAWTTSTQGASGEAPMEITALLDGYSTPPTKRSGAMCIAHAATNGHEVGAIQWDWDSTAHPNFNLNQRQIWDNLGSTSGYMTVTAVDEEMQEDTDDVWVGVSSTGAFCEG
jgi:hypothetical protein